MSDLRPETGVVISFREIYDQIVGLRDDVRSLTQSSESVKASIEDHEARLRSMERWKYSVPAAVVTSIGSATVALLKSSGAI